MNKRGKLFVISAPSGAGKTTLCTKLMECYDNIRYSISFTTREPRFDEIDGKDYYFIDKDRFQKMIENDEFIEWALVHGNYYGTSKKLIMDYIKSGKDVLLDIDPQGARQLKNKLNYGIYIFIIAPSMRDLKSRLINRRTESMDKIELRLQNAKKEIAYFKEYDYIIVNKDINSSYKELESIYIAEHLKTTDIDKIEDIFDMED
ncbi:MAG: guanylate kinase [Deferribacterales bacterium]